MSYNQVITNTLSQLSTLYSKDGNHFKAKAYDRDKDKIVLSKKPINSLDDLKGLKAHRNPVGTYKEYVEEAYTKKERKSFITLAGQAFEDEEYFQDFYAYYKMLIESGNYDVTHDVHAGQGNKIMDPETFAVKLGEQPTSWIFSMYCGMVMLAILLNEK